MPVHLDIKTLVLTGVCICFLLGIILFLFRRSERTVRGIGSWSSAFFILGFANTLLAIRGMVPDLLSIVAANTLAVVSLFLLYRGLRKFEAERPNDSISLASTAFALAGSLWFTYIINNVAFRIGVITISSSVIAIQIGCFLLKRMPPMFKRAYRTEAGIFFFFAACVVARAVYSFTAGDITDLMTAGTVHGALFLANIIFAIAGVFGFLWIVDQRTEEAMVQMAITDPLTGLFNRRHAIDRLGEEIERASRLRKHLGLIMVDLDNLKAINDGYGHLTGDEILKLVAVSLRKSVRKYDIVGRYGGDEFIIVLPDSDIDTSMLLAERVRETATTVALDGIVVSLSLGVTCASPGDTTMEDVIRRADDALYAAKNSGKNHVRMASPE